MIRFEEAEGGLAVQANGKVFGFINKNGFLVAQNLRESIYVSPVDLRQIADKVVETAAMAQGFYSVDG
jgi:hypothetical protein